MSLSPGDRIGVFEIVTAIGAGGMGEVYRARDTSLKRDVAIKVLPHALVADRERLARFRREAELLATLNHPHIAHVYGFESREADGSPCLVMELVEGQTLAMRLTRAAIPLREALVIAGQIAAALEAAHDQGIVHRDLKPANIIITKAGAAKVLDFGLAKATDGAGAAGRAGAAGSDDLSHTPTITSPQAMTQAGAILGTAAYMSPEQARGFAVDKRTDIWAFGCVLHEMLSGRSVFGRATMTDTMAAVLEHEPDWSAIPSATPVVIQRLLRRCLEKDVRRRLHDIADARIEIEDAVSGAATETKTVSVPAASSRLPWAIAVVASLAALTAGGAFVWRDRAPAAVSPASRTTRTSIATPATAALSVANLGLTMTVDGTRIVYIGNRGTQILVRPLDQLEATPVITGVVPMNFVCVSPDGQWVGFVEGTTLRKVAMTGGPPADIAASVNAATWASDHTIIFADADQARGLSRVSADGGAITVLTTPDPAKNEQDHLWPEVLPDGTAVLFTITAVTGGPDAAQVALFDLSKRTTTVLVRGGGRAHFVRSGAGADGLGHLVYAAGGGLRAVPFDLARRATRGPAVPVLPRLTTSPLGDVQLGVSSDGTLAYIDSPNGLASRNVLVWVDRQGREEAIPVEPRPYYQPRLSPDGSQVAVAIGDQDNDLWVLDLAKQTLSQRTFGPATDFFPVWSRDGRSLVFASDRGRGASLMAQPSDGTGKAEPLGDTLGTIPSDVTPDGRSVLFSRDGRDLMMLALSPGGSPLRAAPGATLQPLIQTPFSERNGVVSPDGQWLAYESDSSGKFEIYVRPFPDIASGQSLVSSGGGARPVWSKNGRAIFYEAPGGAIMEAPVKVSGKTWSASAPVKVLQGPYASLAGSNRNFDVSGNGERFLMVKRSENEGPQIVVVQNWFAELRRLAPPAP